VKSEPIERPATEWRRRVHEVVFEAETLPGKVFDIILIILILASVASVMLESIRSIREQYGLTLAAAEWAFTILFTLEYFLRIVSTRRPTRYIFSFYGLIDLFAILPSYLSLPFPGTQYLLIIRILRLLRIFRILKLTEYSSASTVITTALRASSKKISVFITALVLLITVIGGLVYVVEGEANGFTDIPTSMYWAVVTLTTVGYGDLAPQTALGKFLASIVMIMGYGIIAVPTGIVTAELARVGKGVSTQVCTECHSDGHDADAVYCKYCGTIL
jgi:voltage-gated potassium channel